MNVLPFAKRPTRLLAFALLATVALAPSLADANLPTVAPPTNLRFSSNPADCASAPLSTTVNYGTGNKSTVAQCQSSLKAGQAVLVMWSWSWGSAACPTALPNPPACTAYDFTLFSNSAGEGTWETYTVATTNFAALAAVSSLHGSCSTLQANWYDSQTVSLIPSAMSNQACVQLPTPSPTPAPTPTPTPTPKPRPTLLHCVAPNEPNPNHYPECM